MLKSAVSSLVLLGSILVGEPLVEGSEQRSTASLENAQQPKQHEPAASVRFGISADAHLMGRGTPGNEALFERFVDAMIAWRPDFVIDLGDFACQVGQGQTSPELHDGQLEGLVHHCSVFAQVPCPHYNAMGNHDVGWIRGGDEVLQPRDLYGRSHAGEDVTKEEFIAHTKIPHRYYSFDVKGFHFIVLDANNAPDETAPPPGHDGVVGGYFIDGTQKKWLAADLAANREKVKVVFCHQELHHTPVNGSGEGGDVPFPPVGKEASYVDNGWELRDMFAADGRVLACFAGHKHRNRWTVHGGVHYITLAATHWEGSYAKVTISDKLTIEGAAKQRSYVISLPADDAWPVWRHDPALSGHSDLKGDLTAAPTVSWNHPLTGMSGLLVIDSAEPSRRTSTQCADPSGAGYLSEMGRKWGMHPFLYALGDGTTLELSENATRRAGQIHPDLPEPQEVTFTDAREKSRLTLRTWDAQDAQPRELWSSPPGKAAWERWNICFGDIDGDGVDEIIVAGHGGVMAYDPRNGALKCECRYGHRSRGFIGTADIDRDGAVEFLDVGLFQIAVEVCDYRDGELRALWGDKIELDIFAHPRIVHTPFDALCDVDGDGDYEVVYNMFNDHGDDQWHLVVRDALTGRVRWDIPRTFLNGSVDLDGDSVRELVGIHTEGRFSQGFGQAFIAHLQSDGLEKLWSHEAARWPERPVLQMPRDRSTWRSAGGPTQLSSGDFDGDGCQGLIFSQRPEGAGTPEVFKVIQLESDGTYHPGWSAKAPESTLTQVRAIADVDSDGADEVLVEWRSNGLCKPHAAGEGAALDIVSWQPLMPRLGQPIAADMHGRGQLTVLATSAVDEVVAVAPPRSPREKPQELWRRPGRGSDQINCLSAADLTGDGKCEVVFTGEAPSGKARVTAADGTGKTLWHVDFDDVHGQRYIFRMGGVSHLWTAHLTDPKRRDVYVSLLRSIMHSDVAYALRGSDGQAIWRQEKAENMGYGGSGMAFADTNGDGLDEIFCGYPACYWTADGRTGEVTFFMSPGSVFPNWAAYAVPIVTDFTGDGKADVLFPSQYVWGLLTLDGRKIWNLPGGDIPSSAVLPGLGDVDGDGKLELGAPFPDAFRCYDAATGEIEWTVKIPPGPYAATFSADLNGDGRDEFFFSADNRLLAVAANQDGGKIAWQVELPARLSEPSFADIDADGKGEILLTCADGNLYCLDEASGR